jgi:colicin import membrane protein
MQARIVFTGMAALAISALAGAAGAATIPCADLPKAEAYVAGLKPGADKSAAEQHIAAAKAAGTDEAACSAELAQVDKFARRATPAHPKSGTHKVAASRARAHEKRAALAERRAAAEDRRAREAAKRAAADRRKAAAEKRLALAERRRVAAAAPRRTSGSGSSVVYVKCADLLHQNRPGGSDYRGPPVPACR